MEKKIALVSPSILGELGDLEQDLSERFGLKVVLVNTISEFANYPDAKLLLIDLRVIPYQLDDIKLLVEDYGRAKVLLICKTKDETPIRRIIKYNSSYLVLDEKYEIPDLMLSIEKLARISMRRGYALNINYIEINKSDIEGLKTFPCDLYIKLADDKVVKIYTAHDQVQTDYVNKYLGNSDTKIYVSENEYKNYLNALSGMINNSSRFQTAIPTSSKLHLASKDFETVNSLLSVFNVNNETLELLNHVFDNVFELVDDVKDIKKFLADKSSFASLKKGRGLSLALLSTVLAKQITSATDEELEKLAVASFFCDFAVKDKKLLNIYDTKSLEFKKLYPKEQIAYLNHPFEACKVVEKIDGINATKVILQHHELPGGDGFPKKIQEKDINELSAIFIISQQILRVVKESDELLPPKEIYHRLEATFEGHFKTYLEDIKCVFMLAESDDDDVAA